MSLNLNNDKAPDYVFGHRSLRLCRDTPLVLMVEDQEKTRSEMRQVLLINGYRVMDTDNGQDAAKRAQYVTPDLLLLDLDIPLLYEMVAARQILKNAKLGTVPVVIVTHDEAIDSAAIMEVGIRRNEYITRVPDYRDLEHLLDYLLPVIQRT